MIVKRRPALAFDRSTRSSTKSSEHGELKSRLLYSRRLRDDCEKFPPVSHPQIYIARETADEIGIRWTPPVGTPSTSCDFFVLFKFGDTAQRRKGVSQSQDADHLCRQARPL
jgi:hypothetical protein